MNCIILLLLITSTVAKDVFLRGEFIEVGIHNVASYGTASNPPSDFVSASQASRWNNGLGFIADWAGDGWTPSSGGFSGDYFLPGSPLENQWDRSITGKLNLHTTASNTTLLCVENLVFDIRGDKHSTCTQHPCGDCNPLDMWYWMSGITDYGGLVLYLQRAKKQRWIAIISLSIIFLR